MLYFIPEKRRIFASAEIAAKPGVFELMVKQHITSILNKTGFDSISKFAIYAVGDELIVAELPPKQ